MAINPLRFNPLEIPAQIPGGLARAPESAFTNLASNSDRGYDMMPDGRFLSITDPLLAEGALSSMTVVLNWFEELKARVPAGK